MATTIDGRVLGGNVATVLACDFLDPAYRTAYLPLGISAPVMSVFLAF